MKTSNNKKTSVFKGASVLITAALLALTMLFTACPNAAGGGSGGNTGGGGSSFIPDTAILTVDPNNKTIRLTVSVSDFKAVEVEGADIDEIPPNTPTPLTATGSKIILKSGAITALDCKGNVLTGVDVRGLSKLNQLNCKGNQLTSLDLTNQSKLFNLNCSANQLTSLRLANQSNLSELHCYGNELASLDLTKQSKLRELHCYSNKLTSLDLTNKTELRKLHCFSNELTSLNLQNTPVLQELTCYKNKLNKDALIRILNNLPQRAGSDNAFGVLFYDGEGENNYKFNPLYPEVKAAFKTAKDIKNWNIKKEKFPGGSEALSLPPPVARLARGDKTEITIKVETSDGKPVTVTGATPNTIPSNWSGGLTLQATDTEITLTGEIIRLGCSNNELVGLDVRELVCLKELNIYGNLLESLDLTNQILLQRLNCSSNRLKKLDLQNLTHLERIFCEYTLLESLNVQNLPKLQMLLCDNSKLTSLTLQDVPALKDLLCYQNKLDAADFTGILNALPERMPGDNTRCQLFEDVPEEENYKFTAPVPADLKAAFINARDSKNWNIQKADGKPISVD